MENENKEKAAKVKKQPEFKVFFLNIEDKLKMKNKLNEFRGLHKAASKALSENEASETVEFTFIGKLVQILATIVRVGKVINVESVTELVAKSDVAATADNTVAPENEDDKVGETGGDDDDGTDDDADGDKSPVLSGNSTTVTTKGGKTFSYKIAVGKWPELKPEAIEAIKQAITEIKKVKKYYYFKIKNQKHMLIFEFFKSKGRLTILKYMPAKEEVQTPSAEA